MKEDEKRGINHPHDVTFKKLFGRTSIARDIIANNLPAGIINKIDLSTLQLIDGSFISESLKNSFSDLMFRVTVAGEEANVALLLEHKSHLDKQTIFQLANYMIRFWNKLIEGGEKKLPPIIPIVLYHGKERWNYETDLRNLIKHYKTLPTNLQDRLPTFKYDMINIQSQAEEDIQAYEPMTRIIIRSFKYIFHDVDQLMESFLISLDELSEHATEEDIQKIVELLLIYYYAASRDFKKEKLIEKIHTLDGKGERIVTILERSKQEGLEQGKEKMKKEIAQNLLVKGFSIDSIIEITGLGAKEVREIKKETR